MSDSEFTAVEATPGASMTDIVKQAMEDPAAQEGSTEREPVEEEPVEYEAVGPTSRTEVEDAPESESGSEDPDSEEEPSDSDVETLTVTTHKGKQKLKVDFSDKDKLKKYISMAAGARKWQAERDASEAKLSKQTAEYSELKETFGKLDDAWSERGVEGVIDLLEGREGAHKDYIAKKAQDREQRMLASPEELEVLEMKDRLEAETRARKKLEKSLEENLSSATAQREEAEQAELMSQLTPAFEKYRFHGKLGDAAVEHDLDETIWERTKQKLSEYPEDFQLTKAVIEKEFRDTSMTYRKMFKRQASKGADDIVRQKKTEAKTNVQVKAKKGYKKNNKQAKFDQAIGSGDLVNALKMWVKK